MLLPGVGRFTGEGGSWRSFPGEPSSGDDLLEGQWYVPQSGHMWKWRLWRIRYMYTVCSCMCILQFVPVWLPPANGVTHSIRIMNSLHHSMTQTPMVIRGIILEFWSLGRWFESTYWACFIIHITSLSQCLIGPVCLNNVHKGGIEQHNLIFMSMTQTNAHIQFPLSQNMVV